MINIMTGSPQQDKLVNILVFLLHKIQVETFENRKMDEILNLFVVVYLKCSQAVQLTLLEDIDRSVAIIRHSQEKIIVEQTFSFILLF